MESYNLHALCLDSFTKLSMSSFKNIIILSFIHVAVIFILSLLVGHWSTSQYLAMNKAALNILAQIFL